MNLAYLQTLLDYHYWARDIVLDAINDVPREKFTAPVESSFKSLRDTVAHMYAADFVWYARWMGHALGRGSPEEKAEVTAEATARTKATTTAEAGPPPPAKDDN